MTAFRTQLVTAGHHNSKWLESGWMSEARARSDFAWIWFRGMYSRPKDDAGFHAWERLAARMRPRSVVRVCFVVVDVVRSGTWERHSGTLARMRWHEYERANEVVREWLLRFKSEYPFDIGVFAEDFAARWVVRCGVPASRLVLDVPITTVSEIEVYDTPTVVRSSRLPLEDEWSRWKMHFPRDELACGYEFGVHGTWSVWAAPAEFKAAVSDGRSCYGRGGLHESEHR